MAGKETVRVLGEKYNPDILTVTDEPKSAQELSEQLDVPIATCYRRIEDLQEVELLELHDRPLSDEHRRVNVYRRNVDGIEITFRDGLEVDLEKRSEVRDKLDRVWRDISHDQ